MRFWYCYNKAQVAPELFVTNTDAFIRPTTTRPNTYIDTVFGALLFTSLYYLRA